MSAYWPFHWVTTHTLACTRGAKAAILLRATSTAAITIAILSAVGGGAAAGGAAFRAGATYAAVGAAVARTTRLRRYCACWATVLVRAHAIAIVATAMGPAVNLDWSLALVNDRFAHASTVAFVALAQTVDTRAVRSTAIA